MHRIKLKIAEALAAYNWAKIYRRGWKKTAWRYLVFVAWLLRRWGDREYRKDRVERALDFYSIGAAVSQDPKDYVRIIKSTDNDRRRHIIIKMLYKYECRNGKASILRDHQNPPRVWGLYCWGDVPDTRCAYTYYQKVFAIHFCASRYFKRTFYSASYFRYVPKVRLTKSTIKL